jgi:hypothetical protein
MVINPIENDGGYALFCVCLVAQVSLGVLVVGEGWYVVVGLVVVVFCLWATPPRPVEP